MTGRASIDGRRAEARGGTILEGCAHLGIEIPQLCAVPGLPAEGSCRLCLVEVEGDGLVPACHTRLREGMTVRTATARLRELRHTVLSWIAEAHPRAALAPEASELRRLLDESGISPADSTMTGRWDVRHPYLRLDPDRCIACGRCVRRCTDLQGQDVLALARRGPDALKVGWGDGFLESDCTACGACVDVCPTLAISDRDRLDTTPSTRTTRSTCGYCGVGCQVDVESADDRVLRIHAVPDAEVNRGHLCAKGRFAHAYHRHPERLTTPLLRESGTLRPVSWERALDWLVARLGALRDQHGADSLGAMTSSRSTNEAAYLLQKLFRTRIGTNNVDCCARVCHSSTALALRQVTGTGAASASYEDIERAGCLVVAGSNPTEAHPVVGARIRQRVRSGVPLLVIDPRRIELCAIAEVHLALRPGTNVPLLAGLAKLLLEDYGIDEAYAAQRLDGLDALRDFTGALRLEEVATITGVAERDLHRAAALLARGPALFVHGLGLSELTQGTASVRGLCNLGMLTGSVGRPGAGMLPLRGQNNVQGNADMGGAPALVTGYQPVGDPAVRERIAGVWGSPPPEAPGLTIPAMIDAAADGRLRGLWVQGEDLVQSDPQEAHVREALVRLDLLVVQELFLSATAEYADLVLPAASVLEQDGTFTNGERRIQRVRAAVAPPGEARPDWEVIRDVATRMGEQVVPGTPADVMAEVARAAPHLFGGVSYERLDAGGLQWPCPEPGHPGTACVHAEGFLRGRGQLSCDAYVASPEADRPGFPWTLITGRVLQHYNVGSMTRRTPSQQLAPVDQLELAPADAVALGIADDDLVEVESQWGRTEVPARRSDRIASGTAFLSFHQPESHANRVTGPQRDPDSDCPEYKVTAVRLRRAEAAGGDEAPARGG